MRKNSTTKDRASKSVRRGRVAVLTGGLVAALALGSTAALAAGAQHEGFLAAGTASSISQAVQKQAAGQQVAAARSRPPSVRRRGRPPTSTGPRRTPASARR